MNRLIPAALATLLGTAAAAQDLYVGGTVDYMRPPEGDTQIVPQRISHLVNQVLDLRKLTDKPRIHWETFDLYPLIKETVSGFSKIKENRSITMTGHDEAIIISDRSKIKQVLINLIANAIKFTDSTGGKIDIQIDQSATNTSIQIRDNGIGIDVKHHDDVFTRFFQVQIEPSTKTKGTGLGLYLSRQFIELLDGSLHLESEIGNGSNFIITIPNRQK